MNGESPFDDHADRYDSWFDNEGKLIFEIEANAFKTILDQLPKPWLEIGVGSGRFAQALGVPVGIDPSTKLIQKAKNRGIEVKHGKAEDRIFPENSFGTVFLIVTICFLDSPDKALQEIHRILHQDGKLAIGLVVAESPWGRFYMKKRNEGHLFYRFTHFLKYVELTNLLTEYGFSVGRTISTLFQKPNEVTRNEDPREGYWPNAGFTIVIANKK